MSCPYACTSLEGNGPPRPVTINEVRMMLHDNVEPYAISDDEITQTIQYAMLEGKSIYDICIDPKTGYPATDFDAYMVLLLTVIQVLENYMIQIRGNGANRSGGGSAKNCGGGAYNAFIDSISEGGSSISFMSMGDLQSIIESKRNMLEQLRIGRWGCAIRVTTGNY